MFTPDPVQILTFLIMAVLFALGLFVFATSPDAGGGMIELAQKRRLRDQIAPLRLARMLKLRGVDLGDFVKLRTPMQLEEASARCRVCRNASRCEAVLRGFMPGGDYGFCSSSETIREVSHKLYRIAAT